MPERIGVCAECGARFRIPESFTGSSAKCKKCGGVVKIEAAPHPAPKLASAAAAAAASPEARAPQVAGAPTPPTRKTTSMAPPPPRPTVAAGEPAAGRPARSSRLASRRGAREEPEAAPGRAGRRARRGAPAEGGKKNNAVLIGGGVALVLIIAGIAGFMMMGDDDETTPQAPAAAASTATETASSPTGEPTTPADAGAPPAGAASDGAGAGATSPSETTPVAPTPDPATPDPATPTDATADGAAKTDPAAESTENVPTTFTFDSVNRAPGTTEDEWKQMETIGEGVKSSGKARQRAMDKLKPFELKAVPILIASLNGLDLTDAQRWVDGYEVVIFLQDDLTHGAIQIPYHGDISDDPKEIARTHKVLTSLVEYWNRITSDPARWEDFVKKYEAKKAGGGAAPTSDE